MSDSYFVRLLLPQGTKAENREALSTLLTGVASRFSFQGLEDWSVELPASARILGAEREFHDLRPHGRVSREMRVYFSRKVDGESFARILRASLEGVAVEPPRRLGRRDWMKEWRKSYRTQKVGKGTRLLYIVPAWKRSPAGKTSVRIYPGQAFGTGTHPTTRLCLEAFLDKSQFLSGKAAILDFGAGTGVLSLGALAIGLSEGKRFRATAVESDPEALLQCGKNAKINRRPLSLRKKLPEGKFDFVFANVLAPVLLKFRIPLQARVKAGGYLVVSGILRSEGKKFLDSFPAGGLKLLEKKREGDWAAFLFHRPEGK